MKIDRFCPYRPVVYDNVIHDVINKNIKIGKAIILGECIGPMCAAWKSKDPVCGSGVCGLCHGDTIFIKEGGGE